MAYTRALNAATQFGDPLVLSVVVAVPTTATNLVIKVPWNNVDLVYAYTVLTAVITTGNCVVTLKKTSSGGTTVATTTIGYSGCAVGDVDEFTMTAGAHGSRKNLLNSDTINVSPDGGANAGQFILYLYFEPSEYA